MTLVCAFGRSKSERASKRSPVIDLCVEKVYAVLSGAKTDGGLSVGGATESSRYFHEPVEESWDGKYNMMKTRSRLTAPYGLVHSYPFITFLVCYFS